MKTVYLFNKPGVADSYFYENNWINHISYAYIQLRQAIEQAGFRFQIYRQGSDVQDLAAMLCFCYAGPAALKAISHLPQPKCLLLIPEPPSLLPYLYDPRLTSYFGTIFTMLDDLVDNQVYLKFHHPHARTEPLTDIPAFEEKKLGIMVHSNKSSDHPNDIYAERHRLAADFSNPEEFDLFGSGWEKYPINRGGLAGDKIDHLKRYKFYFAYENTRDLPGYVTERIFDAFFGGTVPIYWGASNIEDYVPKSCFIDRRDFASNQELYRYLKSVDAKRYHVYREAAIAYLQTPQAKLFSPEHFARTIVDRIKQCVGYHDE